MTTVTLYATNSDLVCAQKDDGPIWEFGPVTPDMYGEFTELALAWHDGDWWPNESDGQHTAESDEGLEAVAVWNSKDLRITYPAGEGVEHLGGAAQRWIHGSEERAVLVGDSYVTPDEAAQYEADEAEALRVLGADDEAEIREVERQHERGEEHQS